MKTPLDTRAAEAANTLERLAVLVDAGLSLAHAWSLLIEDEGGDATVPVEEALAARGGPWRDVAVAWTVADTVGAPLAPSLRAFAQALRDTQQARDAVALAGAEPAATVKLVTWLPLIAVGLGVVLGFDVIGTLTHPLGLVCVVLGILLMFAASRWTKRLLRAAAPDSSIAGTQGDVLAIALSAGVSVERAREVLRACGADANDPVSDRALVLSARAGAPAAGVLRAMAAEERRRARTAAEMRAARLGTKLLLPLGLCTLPAFLLLGVGPMLLSVLDGATVPLLSPSVPIAGAPE